MDTLQPGPAPGPPPCAACRLRKTGAFTAVSADEMAFIESFRASTLNRPAGSTLMHEQKPGGKLFTLYAGWAFRYKTLSDGRRQILNFLLPGDLIGLQQEFSDGAMHGIEAVTDVSLCVFPRDGLWELFRRYPNLGYDITWLAAREEGMVDDNLLSAGRRNAAERVAMLLMHLYRRLRAAGAGAGRIGRVSDQPAAHRRHPGPVAGAYQQDHAAPAATGPARNPQRAAVAAQPQGAAAPGRLLRRAAAQGAAFIARGLPLSAPDNPAHQNVLQALRWLWPTGLAPSISSPFHRKFHGNSPPRRRHHGRRQRHAHEKQPAQSVAPIGRARPAGACDWTAPRSCRRARWS